MDPVVHQVMEVLALPPGIILLTLLLALLFLWRRPRLAAVFILLDLLLLYALSIHVPVPDNEVSALSPTGWQGAQAIVILAGGRQAKAPEYDGEDTVNQETLVRIRYGAKLQRRTGLPILVTGGNVLQQGPSEAALMHKALQEEFGVPVRWLEENSRTTWENATMSRALLAREGIDHILLVTHGMHMARAAWAFRQAGFQVIPAPTLLANIPAGRGWLDWLPTAGVLAASTAFLHERIGLIWYRIWQQRHPMPPAPSG